MPGLRSTGPFSDLLDSEERGVNCESRTGLFPILPTLAYETFRGSFIYQGLNFALFNMFT